MHIHVLMGLRYYLLHVLEIESEMHLAIVFGKCLNITTILKVFFRCFRFHVIIKKCQAEITNKQLLAENCGKVPPMLVATYGMKSCQLVNLRNEVSPNK